LRKLLWADVRIRQFVTELLARRSRNQSNGVETQSAQRLGSRSQRNASASVTSFELRALCDKKSCSENKILRVRNTETKRKHTESRNDDEGSRNLAGNVTCAGLADRGSWGDVGKWMFNQMIV
jgi:hypothetical protein